MKHTALLIVAGSIGLLVGFADNARAACEITGTPSSTDLLQQYLGRGACTCSALNAVCLQLMPGADPRSANMARSFCAGSLRQCMRKGVFPYRTYTVVGAARS